MAKTVSIGKQDFASLREQNSFYIDKTDLIRAWWESMDDITLITRPRRFGKTLNMDMLKCFFSNQYADRGDLFEGLSIWNEEKWRGLQGTYPVLFLSFAAVKADQLSEVKKQINMQIARLYEEHRYLLDGDLLSENEKAMYRNVSMYMEDAESSFSINLLCQYLYRYYGKKVIVLLDEYDTPMQEAYVHGYWDVFTSFLRSLFNATFKSNPYLERAVLTGITRVSKQSIFSDLNNLNVITTTSEEYATYFGFTEQEVFQALEEFGLADKKELVKQWYDGFTFGSHTDIYNPWSITNYLDKKKIGAYWAATSSNTLINSLIQQSATDIKEKMETLLQEKEILVTFDEQIVFEQLQQDKNAIWSLLLASGYLKVLEVEQRGILLEPWYHLKITNLETLGMFTGMFKGWFSASDCNYNAFVQALLQGNLKEMNVYMNDVALVTFSSFDTGRHPSGKTQPERFYHGFVLGLLAELRDRYVLKSNRESGYGRYDVMLIPRDFAEQAYVLEFKVHDPEEEESLQETVQAALMQIQEKQYDAELSELHIKPEQIHHYGFAFEGKKVLIGGR
ncbi:AAA family ATPase [uncultured Eubacterium sp.]|uniref:AAA family ATPase n=1 Tax=uncultured Eubacterium sp. TaxID=165185 RepID=UPI0015AE6FE0|nr:AAA family ATPase [uncultured Eubacterium sp.]